MEEQKYMIINITYDTTALEDEEWITGETCTSLSVGNEVAGYLMDDGHPRHKKYMRLLQDVLDYQEELKRRHYVFDSIKRIEKVEI
jgi:hypothetical protein